jgi:hypothetical protein
MPVLSDRTVRERFWRKVDKRGPLAKCGGRCWAWLGAKSEDGYGRFKRRHAYVRAHRYSWESNFGPVPEGLCVLHRCDNPSCVRPSHLFVGTNADNSRDMLRKGRHAHASFSGQTNPQALLTEEDVREIKRRCRPHGTESTNEVAEYYGVSRTTIYDVIVGRTWGHVQ